MFPPARKGQGDCFIMTDCVTIIKRIICLSANCMQGSDIMYKTVLFDLDGTLTDPGIGITNSVAYALKKYGIEGQEREKLYSFIGPPLNDSFKKYYGFSDEKAMEAIGVYREYFRDKGIFENEVYDGIRELLQKIKVSGRKIVLATSKPEEFALTILEHFELIKYFDVVAGASMDEKRNKKGDVIRYALEKGCLTAENAVMVGDREHDVFGAGENGIDTIGVLYGYGSRDELEKAGAMYIAETVDDIFDLL